jgi:tape measure domain-containing protein
MADIQQTVELIFRGQNQTNAAIAGIERDLAALSGNADTSTRALSGTNDQLERIGGNRAGIQSATVALQALAGSLVIKDFIDANVAIEQFRNTLKLVTGSTEAANKELDFITSTANRLGVEVRGAASAYASFAAAAKGTAAEGEGSRLVFEGFATAFAALGTSGADVSGAFTQLAQGVSKGKFELDDLKSVAERLPGFFNTFAQSLNVTNEEFFDLISKGKIGIPELIKVAEQLKTQFGSADFSSFNNELSRLKNALTAIQTEIGDAGAFKSLTKSIEGVTIVLIGSTLSIGLFAEGLGTLVAASISALNTINEFRKGNISLAEAQRLNIENNEQFKTSFGALLNDAANAGGKLQSLRDKFLGLDDATNKTATSSAGLAVALGDEEKAMLAQVASAKELTDAKGKVKDKSAELAKQQLAEQKLYLDTTKAAQDYAVKLQSIASNERIKLIESRVKLEIAQAVADAQKFESALKSLSATVESSGDVISSIFSAFGDIEGFFGLEKLELVQEQLKIENKIREQALDLQRQLIESQINLNQSRTASLQRGNALIQIDGKGLQPHLEAFMWEILKTIQTRVNADGLELLVGT